MAVEIRPLQNIGAEVLGLNVGQPIDEATKAALYQAWLDHGVLLFRGAGVSSAYQIALSKAFGELKEHDLKSLSVDGSKDLIEVSRGGKPMAPSYYIDGKLTSGYIFWHQDLVYTPSICKGGMLRMVEKPAQGGETGWIDTALVYDALSDDMKKRVERLEVRHRLRLDLGGVPFGLNPTIREASMEEAPYERLPFPTLPDVVHPLVSTHPETGRKSLGISPLSLVDIVNLPKEEGDALLRELVEHALQPKFMLIHDWAVNDMVIWDNRRTIHSAFGCPPGMDRVAQRTTLAGGMNTGRLHQEAVAA